MRSLALVCADPGIPADGTKGASVHLREMARAFRARGLAVQPIVARGGPGSGDALPGAYLVPPARSSGPERERAVLANSAAIDAALEDTGPFDVVYERLSLFSTGARDHVRRVGVPFVVEVNAPLWQEAALYRSLYHADLARDLCIEVLEAADLVVAVSSELAATLVDEGIDASRVLVLGNGVRLEAFDSATPEPRPEALADGPLLVFSGSLKEWHGLDFLFDALAAYRTRRSIMLRVIGDGPLRDRVRREADLAPAHVWFDGALPHERIPGLLTGADAVVAPYTYASPRYFSPLKIVEGIAARRPILAARVASVVEAVAGAPDVFLFTPGDVADFARALDALLAAGPAKPTAEAENLRRQLSWTFKAGVVLDRLAEQLGRAEAGDPR